jgi:hypothetical protein
MAKRRGSTITVEAHVDEYVDAEVRINELDDEDLMAFVDEAKRRGLLGGTKVGSRRERMVDVYQALVANRYRGILEKFELAIFPHEDDQHLLECWRALQRGEYGAAVCFLDAEVYSDTSDRHQERAKAQSAGAA